MKGVKQMCANTLKEAIDGAQYVEYLDERRFAVWHGGHTVNFYIEYWSDSLNLEVEPTDCINVGNFATDDVSLEEVKEGIKSVKEQDR